MNYDLYKATGAASNGEYVTTSEYLTPVAARKAIKAKLTRRGGGSYEILSRLARGTSARGQWSGGECRKVKPTLSGCWRAHARRRTMTTKKTQENGKYIDEDARVTAAISASVTGVTRVTFVGQQSVGVDDLAANTQHTDFELIFDNGGGATFQTAYYTHCYDNMQLLAYDVKVYLADGDTSAWEGNDEDARIDTTTDSFDNYLHNGGYIYLDGVDVRDMTASDTYPWHNINDFRDAMFS